MQVTTSEPKSVQLSTSLLIVVILYCGCMGFLLVLIGSFSGPHVFGAGLVHALVAVVSYYLRAKLLSRARWAWLLTISFSLGASILLCIAAYQIVRAPNSGPVVIFPLLFVAVFVLIILFLLRRDARSWFEDQNQGTGVVSDQ
jgi:hypothetical protein